jgi:hypothetical protein
MEAGSRLALQSMSSLTPPSMSVKPIALETNRRPIASRPMKTMAMTAPGLVVEMRFRTSLR